MGLLDVGCGRGGPAAHLAERFGCRVTGVDLVPYNVARATENAREASIDVEFVVADATQLPFTPSSFGACTAIDALVYLPDRDRERVFATIADVLEPDGVFVASDLVMQTGLDEAETDVVDAFADTWDMPSLGTVEQYTTALAETSLELETVEDITAHSVGRFRKWTTLYLRLLRSPMGPLLERLLRAYGLDPGAITNQVRHAHDAVPFLEHVLFVAKKEGSSSR